MGLETGRRDKGSGRMADHNKNEHEHGSMDIRSHEKTFEGFIRLSIWVACVAIGILIFMGLVNS
jgi:Ni,Fe-hydrogenase I cytochrome b subunit